MALITSGNFTTLFC